MSTWLREGEALVESVLQVTTAVGVGALHLDLGPATSSLLHDLRKHQQSIHHQVTRYNSFMLMKILNIDVEFLSKNN